MTGWRDRVEVYRSHREVVAIKIDDATLDEMFERAEHGAEFGDVEVMALIIALKDARSTP